MMIKKCTTNDIKQITDLAFKKNTEPEHNSAFCCNGYDSIKQDFLQIIDSKESTVIGRYEGETLIGVMGIFVDEEKHTADCCGPFVSTEGFCEIAKSLFNYAKTLPNQPLQYKFCFDKRNRDCMAFMDYIGAENQGNECFLTLKRKNYSERDYEVNIKPLSMEFTDDFITLHDTIFPDVYVSGNNITHSLEASRKVFCIIENGELIGYSVLKLTLNSSGATAEVIAVDKKHRKKGYGRALLNEVIKQAFYDESISYINLVVENINTNAMNLYYSTGFKLNVENCSYCVK